jgi:hypothetical protein
MARLQVNTNFPRHFQLHPFAPVREPPLRQIRPPAFFALFSTVPPSRTGAGP